MKATIGLPFHNNKETLVDAIRSVFAQTFQDWELILVDDGSQDRSLEIARRIDDPRVRILSDGANKGLAARLNQIADLARGHYLVRMDADDVMHPCRLEKQLAILDQQPKIDVVGSAMYSIDSRNAVQGIRGNHPLQITPRTALSHGILVHVSVVASRQWFIEHPYDISLRRAQDRDLWCRACLDSTFSVIPHPLMYVRETDGERIINNYLRGCRSERTLIRKYGPSFVGKMGAQQLIGKSYLKSAVHKLAHLTGMHHALIKHRNASLTQSEKKKAIKGLQQIQETFVPGLPRPVQRDTNTDLRDIAA